MRVLSINAILATTVNAGNGEWEWIRPLPQGNQLVAMAHSDSTAVAVGAKGTILHTTDGGQWNFARSGTTEDLLNIVRWKNEFLALDRAGSLLRSADGLSWTAHKAFEADSGTPWMGIVSDRIYVSANYALYASSDLMSWVSVDNGIKYNAVHGVSYGNNMYLADCGFGDLYKSADGTNWTFAAKVEEVKQLGFEGAQFYVANAKWQFLQSSNGVDWVSRSLSIPSAAKFVTLIDNRVVCSTNEINACLAFKDGYLAVGNDGLCAKSADGARWISDRFGIQGGRINSLSYQQGKHHLLGNNGLHMTSANGTHWKVEPPCSNETLLAYIVANGVELTVGKKAVFRREAGQNWNTIALPVDDGVTSASIAYGNGMFLLTFSNPESRDTTYFTSADGLTWAPHICEFWLTRKVIFAEGKFYSIIYDDPGFVIASSDGLQWSVVCQNAGRYPTDICWGNGVFAVVCEYGGNVLRSTDGLTWNFVPSFTSSHLYAVSYGNGSFYAAGAYVAAKSVDGAQWEKIYTITDTSDWFAHVSVGETNMLIASEEGIACSPDGSEFGWSFGVPRPYRTTDPIHVVNSTQPTPSTSRISSGGGMAIYGVDGGIYYSKDLYSWKLLHLENDPYYYPGKYQTLEVNGTNYGINDGYMISVCLEVNADASVTPRALPMEGYARACSTSDRCFIELYDWWTERGSVLFVSQDMVNWHRIEWLGRTYGMIKVASAKQKYLALFFGVDSSPLQYYTQIISEDYVGGSYMPTTYLSIDAFKDRFYAVSKDQIFSSDDGVNWKAEYTVVNGKCAQLVATGEELFVLLEGGDMLRSRDGNGSNWEKITVPSSSPVVQVRRVGESVLCMTKRGELLVSHLLWNNSGIVVEQPAGTSLADGGTSDFGSVSLGETGRKVFTLRNTGTLDLTGLTLVMGGVSGGEFTVGALTGATLAPGASTSFEVIFTPSQEVLSTATISIVGDDTNADPFDITLSGSGIIRAPEIAIEQPLGTNLAATGVVIDFGCIAPGSVSGDVTFTVRNLGTAELSGLEVTKDGPNAAEFTVGALGTNTLAVGSSTAFNVTLTPTETGIRTAVLHIASNDSDENPFNIEMTGICAITSQDYVYILDRGAVTITKYIGLGGAVTIPGTINGLLVTVIGDNAFYSFTNLTSITIPNSVSNIKESAFCDCSSLKDIYFQGNVPSLGGLNVFTGTDNATVYYYAGTTGWGPTYGGLATVMLPTQPLTNNTNGFWQSGPSLLTARDQFAGGVLDGKLIVFGGNGNPSGENLKSMEMFDPAVGSWAYKADNDHNGGEGVEELSGAVVNGKFYVVGAWGGGTPYGVFNFVEEYDPTRNIWTSRAPMPTARSAATAVAYNDKVYVFGGAYNNDFGNARTNYTVVEAYDPANNTWAIETYLPTCRQSPAVAVVGNKAYVMGGAYGSYPAVNLVAEVSVYDFVARTWSTNSCAPLPTPAAFSYSAAAPVKDGKIYLIGAYLTGDITAGEVNSNKVSTCFYIYDTVSDTWAKGDPLPGGQIEYGLRAIIGDDLWVAGGDIAWNLNGSGEDLISGAVWKHSLTNIVVSQTTVPATNKVAGANFVWARRIASTVEPDDELAMGLAMDSKTNLYVTGWFDGINDFGGVTLTNKSGGGQDLFVGKYNSAGVLQWARRAGGDTAKQDAARGVGVDSVGNVYVTGGFCGTADFGSTNLTASQDKAFLLAKYDSSGTVQWARQNAGGGQDAYGTGLAVDASGNSYAVGCYGWDGSTVTFGSTTLPNPGNYGTFLVKYNSAGTLQWAKAINGSGYAYSTKIVLDSAGNACLSGTFEGSLMIGATTLASAGGKDSFVAKFNSAGALQWARQMGGTGDDMGDGGIAVDAANNVFIGGGYSSNIMRFGGTSLTNAGSLDAFVAKYNSAGTLQWARRFGSKGLDLFSGVAADLQGNVYAAGCISTNTTPGGSLSLSGWDAVAVKYDASGSVQWVQTAGGSGNDIGYNVVADPAGNTYLNGWFQDTAAFGTNTLYSQGYWNFFLAKLPSNIPRDLFAGTYSPLIEFDNTVKNGVAIQKTTKPLAVSQTDATHYSVQLSSPAHPTQGAFSFEAERVGNRIQNVDRPIQMAGWSLWDYFMMSDGTNGALATISQESADPQDISFQVGSWSSFKGNVTIDDFVGSWTGESYGNDNVSSGLNPGDFVSQSGGTTTISRADSTHIRVSSPGGGDQMPLSLTLRVSGNEAYLESSPVSTANAKYHAFRIRTDGQKVVYYVVGQELNDAADVSVTIGLGVKVKGIQSVTFPMLPAKGVGDADFSPGATASSGLAVTYASSDPSVATIVAGKIHIVGMGKAVITATQAGNNNWNPAPDVTQELTVGKAIPVITWANPSAIVYGTLLSTVQLNAKASVPGQFVYTPVSGLKLPAGTNTLNVTFTPADTNRYSSANKSILLVVNKASQTITFKALPIVALGTTNFNPGAVSSSGLTVEYASANPAVAEIVGGLIHVTGAGTTVITARQLGNFDFKAATPVSQALTVKALLTAEISGAGTVTGAGLYTPGTKVALMARAAAGNTFLLWEDGTQTTTRSLVMPNENVTVSAWFGITTNVPKPIIVNPGPLQAMVGVPFNLVLDITSESLPTVTLTGLPTGLSYSDSTKTIAGVPTASVTNRTVTVTAKNVNKTAATEIFTMTVDPLPAWAQGNFNGWFGGAAGDGPISGDVTAQGKISGKLSSWGTNYTFSAASYARRGGDGAFWITATASVAKVSMPLTLAVRNPAGVLPPNLSVADGWFAVTADGTPDATLWRNVWKDAGMAAVATNYTGYYTAVLPGGPEYGSGYLLITVDKLGGVKTTGKLADGTAVSLSGWLILDEAGRVFTVLYTAPAVYKGGSLFGVAEFFKGDAGTRVTVRPLDDVPFLWESLAPAATQVYGAGFSRYLDVSGGWYDTLGNLYAYYANRTLTIGTEGDPVPELLVGTNRYDSVCWDPDGLVLTVVTNKSGVMTGLAAPKAGVPVKDGAAYDYANPTNAVGLAIGLTRATGVFKGSFKAWFDYVTTHTSKTIVYEGVLTPERENKGDGVAGRGFFLWADKSQYLNQLGRPVSYSFNWSYDLSILLSEPAP